MPSPTTSPITGSTASAPSSGGARLAVRSLRKVYTGRGEPVEAIADLTFEVRPGELVCVVGPSGAGKTTLLRCMAGLLAPTSGEVVLGETAITGPPQGMAVVLQEYGRSLFPWMTVAQNVELPLKEKGVAKARRAELVRDTLEAVGLGDVTGSYPWQLSGGMQQRVAIARAAAYEPQVLLMDEPFAAVDAQTRFDLEDLVRTLWKRLGITVVFVTHDIDEAIYLGERVLVLSARPTVVLEDVEVSLGPDRDQLETRGDAEFARLRTHVYELVQQAKKGVRTLAEAHLTHPARAADEAGVAESGVVGGVADELVADVVVPDEPGADVSGADKSDADESDADESGADEPAPRPTSGAADDRG